MKRLITFFFVLLTLLWALPVFGQAQRQVFSRVRDAANPNWQANVGNFQLTLTMTTTFGLSTRAGVYYYDLAGLRLWHGDKVDHDDIDSATFMPYTASFGHIYDRTPITGDNWDRMSGLDITLEPKDFLALLVYSANMYWSLDDGFFRDWEGRALNDDAISTDQQAPYVGNFSHHLNTDTMLWKRVTAEIADGADIIAAVTAAHDFALNYVWDGGDWKVMGADANGDLTVNQTTTTPGYGRVQDGDSTTLVDVTDAGTFDLANTLNGIVGDMRLYGWDGSAWDPLLVGATGSVQTETTNHPNAYDSGRALVMAEIKTLEPMIPATEDHDGVNALTTICQSTEIIRETNVCVWVYNDGGAQLTALNIEVSYNGAFGGEETTLPLTVPAEYSGVREDNCSATLAGGASCSYCWGFNAYRYVRVQVNSGGTDVQCTITANPG